MKFSLGYNQSSDFIEKVLMKNQKKISSIYFPLPTELGSSGRPSRKDPKYIKKLIKLIRKSKKQKIRTKLLINGTYISPKEFSKKKLNKLFFFIDKMISIGLDSIVITNFLYLKILKKKFPNLEYISSVNSRLKNIEQAIYFKKLGIDTITIDRDINRKLSLIKKIKKRSGLKIQIMLNEPCLSNCPFRKTHFDFVSCNKEKLFNKEFEDLTCYPMIKNNKKLFFRIPFVRPEDLKYYKNIADEYKLVTRDASNQKINLILNAYFNEKYNGNLINLFDLEKSQYLTKLYIDNKKLNKKNFFKKIQKCKKDCNICNICNQFLE